MRRQSGSQPACHQANLGVLRSSPGHEHRRDGLEDTPIHALSVFFGKRSSSLAEARRLKPVTRGQTFSAALSLPGHTDWVRCLTFSTPLAATRLADSQDASFDYKEGDILLASGSQDNYIRLWRFTPTRSGANGLDGASGSTSILKQAEGKSALDLLDDLDEGADGEIAAKQYTFSVNDNETSTS